jgi:hypothetical protein
MYLVVARDVVLLALVAVLGPAVVEVAQSRIPTIVVVVRVAMSIALLVVLPELLAHPVLLVVPPPMMRPRHSRMPVC